MTNRHKLRAAAIALAAFHAVILFAGFAAPYDYSAQNRDLPFAPPTRIHFVDAHGEFHARPFVYGLRSEPAITGSYEPDFEQIYPLEFFATGSPYKIAGLIQSRRHLL
ncbi:MAG: hypothetical protein WB559_00190, partial [Candidatus Acidiferrales bacterium]